MEISQNMDFMGRVNQGAWAFAMRALWLWLPMESVCDGVLRVWVLRNASDGPGGGGLVRDLWALISTTMVLSIQWSYIMFVLILYRLLKRSLYCAFLLQLVLLSNATPRADSTPPNLSILCSVSASHPRSHLPLHHALPPPTPSRYHASSAQASARDAKALRAS